MRDISFSTVNHCQHEMHMYRLFILISVIGALSIPTFSQTGPAGVGNTSSNILWLDAQNPSSLSGSLVNDDPITTWSDVSGNGNDFVQQGADPVPVFRNDGLYRRESQMFATVFFAHALWRGTHCRPHRDY